MIIPGLYRRAPAPVDAPYPYMLIPADDRAAEVLAKLPGDKPVTIKVSRDRSSPQHRLFFAVLTYVAGATHWETPERLLVALKIRLGRYEPMALPSGKMVPVPDSISFAAMDQEQFAEFFDQAIEVICADVLPGISSVELIEQAQAALGIAPASADEPLRAEGEGAIVADRPPPPAEGEGLPTPTAQEAQRGTNHAYMVNRLEALGVAGNSSGFGPEAAGSNPAGPASTEQNPAGESAAVGSASSGVSGPRPGTARATTLPLADAIPTIEIVKPHGGKPDWMSTSKNLIAAFCELSTVAACDAFRAANNGTVSALRNGNLAEHNLYQQITAAHELALREKGK